MEIAARKFKKYAASIENDIQALMFELIDIINAKTITLRYLMKLHLQIKTIASIKFKDKKHPGAESTKTLSIFSNSSEFPSASYSNKIDPRSKGSLDEVSEIKEPGSLSAIQKDIDKKLEEVSYRLTTIENLNKEIDLAEYKNQDDIIKEAKKFINDLVDKSVLTVEQKYKKNNSNVKTPESRERNTTPRENNISADKKHKNKEPFTPILSSSQVDLEGVIHNLQRCKSILTSKLGTCTNYRTVVDTKQHRLIQESNNVPEKMLTPQVTKERPTDLEIHFESNKTEIKKIHTQNSGKQVEYLFPEASLKNSFGIKPHKALSSSIIASSDVKLDFEDPRRPQTSTKSFRSCKSTKSTNSTISKIVLDNNTYKKICSAIKATLTKDDLCQLGEGKTRKNFKSSSNYGFTPTKKTIPMRSTDLDLHKFLNLARIKKYRSRL